MEFDREETWLSDVIAHLNTLRQVWLDGAMPSMIDDGDAEERINEIEELIEYLQRTN